MSDPNQRLAIATEDLRKHFSGALAAAREISKLLPELDLVEFVGRDASEILTDLVLLTGTVHGLERDVVAYFSIRASRTASGGT